MGELIYFFIHVILVVIAILLLNKFSKFVGIYDEEWERKWRKFLTWKYIILVILTILVFTFFLGPDLRQKTERVEDKMHGEVIVTPPN